MTESMAKEEGRRDMIPASAYDDDMDPTVPFRRKHVKETTTVYAIDGETIVSQVTVEKVSGEGEVLLVAQRRVEVGEAEAS